MHDSIVRYDDSEQGEGELLLQRNDFSRDRHHSEAAASIRDLRRRSALHPSQSPPDAPSPFDRAPQLHSRQNGKTAPHSQVGRKLM